MNFEALVKHISTIQNTLQAQAAHAVNLALTSRNWLMGCYIVEFEQNGEDRAAYGEQLLKKLEQRLKTKGLNERRFREFRRLYLVYPQLKEPVTQYIASQIQIRQSLTAEFTEPIRRLVTAESENGVWKLSTVFHLPLKSFNWYLLTILSIFYGKIDPLYLKAHRLFYLWNTVACLVPIS